MKKTNSFYFIKVSGRRTNFIFIFLAITLFFTDCGKDVKTEVQQPPPNGQITNNGCSLAGQQSSIGGLFAMQTSAEVNRVTNEELNFLSQSFLVAPAFFWFDDSNAKNAFSTPDHLGGSVSADGTVVFGINLFLDQINLSIGGTNVPIILAHEFAHTVAHKYGLNLVNKNNELFADYLAGMYIFYRNKNFKSTDVNAAFQAFYNMGDNNFTDASHHGTPESRATCITAGYNDSFNAFQQGIIFTLDDAVHLGVDFVSTHVLP